MAATALSGRAGFAAAVLALALTGTPVHAAVRPELSGTGPAPLADTPAAATGTPRTWTERLARLKALMEDGSFGRESFFAPQRLGRALGAMRVQRVREMPDYVVEDVCDLLADDWRAGEGCLRVFFGQDVQRIVATRMDGARISAEDVEAVFGPPLDAAAPSASAGHADAADPALPSAPGPLLSTEQARNRDLHYVIGTDAPCVADFVTQADGLVQYFLIFRNGPLR